MTSLGSSTGVLHIDTSTSTAESTAESKPTAEPARKVPTANDILALHHEAVEVSQAAQIHEAQRAADDTSAFVGRAAAAQEGLRAHVLANVESAVLSAAAGGQRDATVYEFMGGDVYEDLSVLFLLLGGHDKERRAELDGFGFEPLVSRLARDLRPFRLDHVWDRETNANALIVSW